VSSSHLQAAFGVRHYVQMKSAALTVDNSPVCITLVLPRETPTRTQSTSRDFFVDDRLQTNICRITRMLETEADVSVSHFLFSYVPSTFAKKKSSPYLIISFQG
jgi:hypothetical protein